MSQLPSANRQPTKTLVMTGGTSGFGRRAIEMLLAQNEEWRIVLLARRSSRLDSLAGAYGPDRLTIVPMDLADLEAVAAAASDVLRLTAGQPIDALAFNAGIQPVLGDQESIDGLELCFAVNHLAHVYLADRLAPAMRDGGRIVITSSVVHDPQAFCLVGITRAQWEDPEIMADPRRAQAHLAERVDRGEARYCASKLLNLMHARHLSGTLPGISTFAFNPSVVPGTEIARDRNFLQLLGWKYVMPMLAPVLPWVRSIDQSAGDLAWLITQAPASILSGQYVDGREVAAGSADSRDATKIARVMAVSRQLLDAKKSAKVSTAASAEKLRQASAVSTSTAA